MPTPPPVPELVALPDAPAPNVMLLTCMPVPWAVMVVEVASFEFATIKTSKVESTDVLVGEEGLFVPFSQPEVLNMVTVPELLDAVETTVSA